MSDPFETLGLPQAFNIDERDLHRRFIQASADSHPDRFTDPFEQAEAAQRASLVNDAYRVLKDPESRANALLASLGGPTKSDDKALPPNLLMEMMETREEMEQAIADEDTQALAKFRQQAQDARAEHLDRVTSLFDDAQNAPESDRGDILKQIRLELNALRYHERMLAQMPD